MKKSELLEMSSAYILDKNGDRLYVLVAFWDVAYIKPMSISCRKYKETTMISHKEAIKMLNGAHSTDVYWKENKNGNTCNN